VQHSRLIAIALGLVLAGCQPTGDPACAEPSVSLEATVTDAAMDPSALAVCRDQDVSLELTSETDEVFHIHGYDEQVPATSLEPGEVMTLEFTADRAGQFIIELHAHSGGDSTEIGVLTVNEP
jgi:hypothetical protein